jgi:16S rRNA (cytidine1402-2'-O)-methyltransferase
MSGTLYVVGTPIGNVEDLSFRALRVLKTVRFIAAEDPYVTQRLLNHYGIETPLTAYHNGNKEEKAPVFMARLAEGTDMALVCDAGTPALFDPGSFLISAALDRGICVTPVPGPSAATTAVSVSGIQSDAFVVQGRLPDRADARRRAIISVCHETRPVVLLLDARYLRSTLELIHAEGGARRLILGKNLTMPDEAVLRGSAAEIIKALGSQSSEGNVTLLIEGGRNKSKVRRP